MIKERITQGEFSTNTYLWENDGAISIIDIGYNPTNTLNRVKKFGLALKSTILTHNHLDHIRGLNNELFEKPVYMHEYDLKNLTTDYLDYSYEMYGYALFKNRKEYENFRDFLLTNKKNITPVIDGEKIENLRVLLTSGHTKGSISLISDSEKLIFTGDTIFHGGYGRTDLKSGSSKDLEASIKKLNSLINNGYEIYPGH